jgi:hypothetical protein
LVGKWVKWYGGDVSPSALGAVLGDKETSVFNDF